MVSLPFFKRKQEEAFPPTDMPRFDTNSPLNYPPVGIPPPQSTMGAPSAFESPGYPQQPTFAGSIPQPMPPPVPPGFSQQNVMGGISQLGRPFGSAFPPPVGPIGPQQREADIGQEIYNLIAKVDALKVQLDRIDARIQYLEQYLLTKR